MIEQMREEIVDKKIDIETQRTEVERVILTRRSCRLYKNKQVPEYLIRRVLEAGRFAPSAGNCQPWRFIVFQDQKKIWEMESILLDLMSPFKKIVNTEGWKRDVIVAMAGILGGKNLGDLRPFGAVREVLEGRLRIFHNAPTVIMVLKDTRGIDSPEFDTGACTQNIVLAAHSLGLACCVIGFGRFLEKNKDWMRKYKIKKPFAISSCITIGYPKYKSDGYVQRDTPQIDYYGGDGSFRTLY